MIPAQTDTQSIAEYEFWCKKYPFVFKSKLAAIKELLPKGKGLAGLELGVISGRMARALGIKEATASAEYTPGLAEERGIKVREAKGTALPYKSNEFDFVYTNLSVNYFGNNEQMFLQVHRILKPGGAMIVSFIEKDSRLARWSERRKEKNLYYRRTTCYTTYMVVSALRKAGFEKFQFAQTLFQSPDEIKTIEQPKAGFGEGSCVLIKAIK